MYKKVYHENQVSGLKAENKNVSKQRSSVLRRRYGPKPLKL